MNTLALLVESAIGGLPDGVVAARFDHECGTLPADMEIGFIFLSDDGRMSGWEVEVFGYYVGVVAWHYGSLTIEAMNAWTCHKIEQGVTLPESKRSES